MAGEQTTADKVRAIIAELLDQPLENVTPEKTFEDLGADSLDAVEAMLDIENRLNVEIDDRDINMSSKVGDLIAKVEKANG